MDVSKQDREQHTDNDSGRGKQRVLRARDIVPGKDAPKPTQCAHKRAEGASAIEQSGRSNSKAAKPSDSSAGAELLEAIGGQARAENQADDSPIPSFDLAGEIMAEQRRVIAERRKGPMQKARVKHKKANAQAGPTEQPLSSVTVQNQIIADIVARDIERLCSGNLSQTRQ